jgi:type III pantothenate kinase
MLLAIDVGNTQTVIGLFEKNDLLESWRMVTPRYETSDEIASKIFSFIKNSGLDPEDIQEISVSCVVPRIIEEIQKMSDKYFGIDAFLVEDGIETGLLIDYDNPEEIGADRIANSIAAKELYGYPAIIVDFGTATTLDILSEEGHYIGGIIAPGIEISSEALFNIAAKLSKVDLHWPSSVIGKNTADCMRSGILYGFLGQVESIIKKVIEEKSQGSPDFSPKIIATGGLSFLIKEKSGLIEIFDPDLTIKGLKILIDKNK